VHRPGRRIITVLAGACVLAGCTSQGQPGGAAGGTARWRVAYQAATSGLTSVTATARDDAWAVGPAGVLHWDGRAWHAFPGPGVQDFALTQVAASSPRNVWVVGEDTGGSDPVQSIYRWDGSGWHQAGLPEFGSIAGLLVLGPGDGDNAALVVPDGHGGAWLGADTHWTGRAWVHENAPDGYQMAGGLARVPGTSSYWSAGYGYVGTIGGSPLGGAVFVFGPLPS
jgi:hypothetical protein